MKSIDVLKKHRSLTTRALSGLSADQWLTIPEGFKNNILWNAGHLVVTQELLTYKLSGLEPHLSAALIAGCSRGTSPVDWNPAPDVDEVLRELDQSPQRLERDFAAGKFNGYQSYTTSTGIELGDIEEAITFNNFHEGLHLGVIMALRKLVPANLRM